MTEHHAGHGFDLDIAKRVALDLREVTHLGLRELDILDVLRVDRREADLDLGVAQAKIVALPAVEFQRHLAHRRVASLIDIVERRLDDRPYLDIGGGSLFTADPTFQYLRHELIPFDS